MKDIEIKKLFEDLECEIKNTPKEILLKEIEEIEKEAKSLPENQYDEFFDYLEQEYNEFKFAVERIEDYTTISPKIIEGNKEEYSNDDNFLKAA